MAHDNQPDAHFPGTQHDLFGRPPMPDLAGRYASSALETLDALFEHLPHHKLLILRDICHRFADEHAFGSVDDRQKMNRRTAP
jgi:hypothetical protein